MVPPGGVEPRAVRPVLRADLEDRYQGRGAVFWITCANCGKESQKLVTDIRRTINDFCSRSCSTAFNNQRQPKRLPSPRVCIECNQTFRISVEKHRGRSGLCPACTPTPEEIRERTLASYRQRLSVAGRHPSWRNAHIRGLNRSWNKHLLRRPCQNCGYVKHIELAHRRPISSFPETATVGEVNALENNLVLCRNCHWEYDHGLLSL